MSGVRRRRRRRRKTKRTKQRGGEFSLASLKRYGVKAGKKAAEMGRFFASEWLREPGAQRFLIKKATPFLRKGIDNVSTAIRPKRNYVTNRKKKGQSGGGLIPGLGDLIYGPNYSPWTSKYWQKK